MRRWTVLVLAFFHSSASGLDIRSPGPINLPERLRFRTHENTHYIMTCRRHNLVELFAVFAPKVIKHEDPAHTTRAVSVVAGLDLK